MKIKLQTIGLIVTDMAKTLAFYTVLGLPIPPGLEEETNVDFDMAEGITLGFLSEATARQADPDFVTPVGQSMNLQFIVDSPNAVDEIYNQIMAAGYQSYSAPYSAPWDAFWGQRFARVIDPDGRIVNIYAHLPS